MRKLVFLFALMITSSAFLSAQQSRSILTESKENFFTEKNGMMVAEFIIKGIDEKGNTKELTQNILNLPGVLKFGIKNQTTENYDERGCVLALKPDTYLNVFPQVMTQLLVNKVFVAGKETDIQSFVNSFHK